MHNRPKYSHRLAALLVVLTGSCLPISAMGAEIDEETMSVFDTVMRGDGTETVAKHVRNYVEKPVKKVLVIGDSMTGWMAERLNAYGQLNDFEVATVFWDGSTISKWAKSGALERYIKQHDPDAVIVSLGLNSLFESNPDRRLKAPAEEILKAIGDRQFLWVGPPSWPGKGSGKAFNEWMERELGPGHYFNSSNLTLPRVSKTNPHPTRKGIEKWVDAVAKWIPENAEINLNVATVPAPGKMSRGKTYIYKRMRETL